MTNTEKRLELLEQSVKEVTDYGFNDEYGYYNDWADGVRPILEKAITQALAEERERAHRLINLYGAPICEHLHHNKKQQHESGEICPVVTEITDLLSKQ